MHADPVADMLTRIRNAVRIDMPEVNIKANKVCQGIAQVLLQNGFVSEYDRIATGRDQDIIRIKLKYSPLGQKAINEIKRVSKPSNRIYCPVDKIPRVMGGLGMAIVSTNKGVLSDQQCRQLNVGGELLCTVS